VTAPSPPDGSAALAAPLAARASPTRPPPGIGLPYPGGCAAFQLTQRRCAVIVDWARLEAGVAADQATSVLLLGDADPGVRRTMAFVVRVRLSMPGGTSSDHSMFCGPFSMSSLACADPPTIALHSPTLDGYRDVPCAGEGPGRCATPLPTLEPGAAVLARALEIPAVDIPIDHLGLYDVPLGTAVLPNGILSEAAFNLRDRQPADLLVAPEGIHLTVATVGPGRPLRNLYEHGWHPGTETVIASLEFSVLDFEPGARLRVVQIRVR
jgi:hypothetical protein